MCKIADPTEKGIWWKNDTKWVLYSPEDARKILRAKKNGDSNITLGSVKSAKYPSGQLYVIDLVAMKQTNVNTGFSRDIKIINSGPIADQEDVESDEEDELVTRSRPVKVELTKQSRGSDKIVRMVPSVTVDLEKLTSQCYLEDECNLVLKLPRVAAAQSDRINSLTKKTLELLLEKLTCKDFIKSVVRHQIQSADADMVWKVCPCQSYGIGRVDNPSMYGPFLTQLCKMAEDDPLFVDQLFSIAEKGFSAEGDSVEYLFHKSRRFTRVLTWPSEVGGRRVSVYLAMSKSVQERKNIPLSKGGALHLSELMPVPVADFDYSS